MRHLAAEEVYPEGAVERGEDGFGPFVVWRWGSAQQRMRWIPPGHFQMGSPEDEEGRDRDEGPQHEVTIPQGFWMGEVPVTQALYEAVMGHNPSRFKGDPRRPVEQVSWEETRTFCARLGPEWRLPTEAEWEYACRAGTQGSSYAPGVPVEELGWHRENSPHSTQPVGLKRANTWGLHDMLGNVEEWCQSAYAPYTSKPYNNISTSHIDVRGLLVVRGGCWRDWSQWLRPAYRYPRRPDFCGLGLGFRIVLPEFAHAL